jgi:molybdenum-dependent DNA-binding transcriptional regulator ModE
MKKLKEVTDRKKISILKNIDEKLTEAARKLGYSLEQRTVKMRQRDKKVGSHVFIRLLCSALGSSPPAPRTFL